MTDNDGDGFGDIGPATGVTAGTDCNDGTVSVYPGATETVSDGVDQDCDGGDLCYQDADNDGYRGDKTIGSADLDCVDGVEAPSAQASGDCDDSAPQTFPGAAPNDSATACMADSDDDGYGDLSAAGAVTAGTDCDDTNAARYPSATEQIGDGVDQSCDGKELCYVDVDNDSFHTGATRSSADEDCADSGEADASDLDGDCDDADPNVFPGASEGVGDEVDQDCDGVELCFVDTDSDGFHAGLSVSSSDVRCDGAGELGATAPSGDCDDGSALTFPGAAPLDSTTACMIDADGDGYGASATSGSVSAGSDCDDDEASVNPSATEGVGDGVDQDCDGGERCYVDEDGDGYRLEDELVSVDADCDDAGEASGSLPTGDCDDGDLTFNPSAAETDCTDPNDYNCDGATGYENKDGDAFAACAECDDNNSSVYPGATETCGDGVDSDCDSAGGPTGDEDGDGLDYGTERDLGSSDCAVDTDLDGLDDAEEQALGTDPTVVDTDEDGLTDGEEVSAGTDPLRADTDADGLSDSEEASVGTDPLDEDSDDDGLSDGEEGTYKTDALDPDTDDDGVNDGDEVAAGTDPLVAESGDDSGGDDTGGDDTGGDDTGGDDTGGDDTGAADDTGDGVKDKDGCGCSTEERPTSGLWLGLLGLLTFTRRRSR
jgi:MYXO-CTERM domain-containing protein